jgi:hypothetical protein
MAPSRSGRSTYRLRSSIMIDGIDGLGGDSLRPCLISRERTSPIKGAQFENRFQLPKTASPRPNKFQ